LTGELELMLAQVLLQGRHFLHMLICHDGPPMGLIKDETARLVKGGGPRVTSTDGGIDGVLRGCL
jgi:hypothetical protein